MTRAEWFAAATLLIATVGLLQTLGFWRAVSVRWCRRREYYPASLTLWLKQRAREASLREAEQAAPGLFAFLRQKLTEKPARPPAARDMGSCRQDPAHRA